MSDFFVLASLYAQPGREAQLREQCIALAVSSRTDAGNLRYEVFADQDDPRRLVFVEHWDSPEAQHRHHTQTEHVRRIEEQKSTLVKKVELFYRLQAIV